MDESERELLIDRGLEHRWKIRERRLAAGAESYRWWWGQPDTLGIVRGLREMAVRAKEETYWDSFQRKGPLQGERYLHVPTPRDVADDIKSDAWRSDDHEAAIALAADQVLEVIHQCEYDWPEIAVVADMLDHASRASVTQVQSLSEELWATTDSRESDFDEALMDALYGSYATANVDVTTDAVMDTLSLTHPLLLMRGLQKLDDNVTPLSAKSLPNRHYDAVHAAVKAAAAGMLAESRGDREGVDLDLLSGPWRRTVGSPEPEPVANQQYDGIVAQGPWGQAGAA